MSRKERYRCPHCGSRCALVECYWSPVVEAWLSLYSAWDGEPPVHRRRFFADDQYTIFVCPDCGEIVT